MTDAPHRHLHHEIAAMSEKLAKVAVQLRENDALIAHLTAAGVSGELLTAERRIVELEAELAKAKASAADLRERNLGQVRNLQAIRVALNGKGRNPMVDHAHAVFQALASALPDHPLVQRMVGDAPEKAALSRTDLRFIYACLDFASEKLGNMGCNDWCIENPDQATLRFMQRVEDFAARDDAGRERKVLAPNAKGRVYGAGNFLVPAYLKRLMREVYGDETFDGAEDAGLA